MYKIFAITQHNSILDGTKQIKSETTSDVIFDDQNTPDFVNALSAKLTMEDNAAGTLTITLPPTHPALKNIELRRTYFAVVRDSDIEYRSPIVPSNYDECKWIRMRGDVDTGIVPTVNTEIDCTFKIDANNATLFSASDSYRFVLSTKIDSADYDAYEDAAPDRYTIGERVNALYYGHYEDFAVFDWGDEMEDGGANVEAIRKAQRSLVRDTLLPSSNRQTHVKFGKEYLTLGDTVYDLRYRDWITQTSNIRLFHSSNAIYIYGHVIITDGYNVVREYVPVYNKQTGMPGVYELKTGTFTQSSYSEYEKKETGCLAIKPIWVGRAKSRNLDWNNSVTFTCTGILDCFNDHITRSLDDENYIYWSACTNCEHSKVGDDLSYICDKRHDTPVWNSWDCDDYEERSE